MTDQSTPPPPRREPLLPTMLVQRKLPAYIEWLEADKAGKAATVSKANLLTLLQNLGTELRFNRFTSEVEIMIRGELVPFTDNHVDLLWTIAHEAGFRIRHADVFRQARVVALYRSYHPITDYLDSLKWDGKPRDEHQIELAPWLEHSMASTKQRRFAEGPVNRRILGAAVCRQPSIHPRHR